MTATSPVSEALDRLEEEGHPVWTLPLRRPSTAVSPSLRTREVPSLDGRHSEFRDTIRAGSHAYSKKLFLARMVLDDLRLHGHVAWRNGVITALPSAGVAVIETDIEQLCTRMITSHLAAQRETGLLEQLHTLRVTLIGADYLTKVDIHLGQIFAQVQYCVNRADVHALKIKLDAHSKYWKHQSYIQRTPADQRTPPGLAGGRKSPLRSITSVDPEPVSPYEDPFEDMQVEELIKDIADLLAEWQSTQTTSWEEYSQTGGAGAYDPFLAHKHRICNLHKHS